MIPILPSHSSFLYPFILRYLVSFNFHFPSLYHFEAFIPFSASFSSCPWSSYWFITFWPSLLSPLWNTLVSIPVSIPVSKFSLLFTFSLLFPYSCVLLIVCHLLSGSSVSIVQAPFDSVPRRSRFEALIDFSFFLLLLLLICRICLLFATRLFCFSETFLSISLAMLDLQLSSEFLSISAYMYVYTCTCTWLHIPLNEA